MRVMNWFRNLSLARKIASFSVITVLLFIVILAGFIAPNVISAISNFGEAQANDEAKIIQAQFEQIEQQVSNAATFLSFAPGLSEALATNDSQQIRTALLFQGEALILDVVRVVSSTGEELLNLQKFDVALDVSALNILRRVGFVGGTSTNVIESRNNEDGSLPQIFLFATTAVKDTSGRVIGAVMVGRRIDTSFLDDMTLGRANTHVGFLYNGTLLATTTDDETRINQLDSAADLIAQAEQGQTAVKLSFGVSATTTPDIQVYTPVLVGNKQVGVFAVRIDYAVLYTLQSSLIQNLRIAVIIAIVIISNVLVVFIQRGIIRPFTILTQQIERITKGEYNQRVEVTSNDEIGRFGASFNQMVDVVQHRESELKTLNQTLEQRVADRTHDLREARDVAIAAQRVAQENSRLKSEFLATMSHELRTPLNAIEGFSSIMLSGMGVELSPIAADMMKRISANSTRLLHLINDFLDLSRIESGRLDLVQEPLNIRLLVNRWRESVSILAEEKRLEFAVVVENSVPEKVVSDEDALTKIVINLLSNAFKFTRKGQVELKLKSIDSRLIISVTDTGIGIPVHAREYIFEEFRQVDGSSKREFGGTGLGLALVSKLTRLLNGAVVLESEVGKGSVFTIDLPLEQEERVVV
jgi:signal transduction histidine kinase